MERFATHIPGFTLRFAAEEDTPQILRFIHGLAEYEHLGHLVTATEEGLRRSLFADHCAEVVFGEWEGEPVGFALFFPNYSTFLGQAGLYLEDLFLLPEYRGRGFGRAVLTFLAQLVKKRGYGRLEWSCLNWNAPSIAFYKRMGAVPMDDWTVFRVYGDALAKLAKE